MRKLSDEKHTRALVDAITTVKNEREFYRKKIKEIDIFIEAAEDDMLAEDVGSESDCDMNSSTAFGKWKHALSVWNRKIHVDVYGKSLLFVLISYANKNCECSLSVEKLAYSAGMSRRKAAQVIKTLEAAGHIEVTRHKGRKSSIYKLLLNPARCAVLEAVQSSTNVHELFTSDSDRW